MRRIIFLIMIFISIALRAQDIASTIFSGYSTDYFGQLNDKGKKDGLGIKKFSNGNLYIGAFRNNKIHGYGMMISGKNGFIDNCNQSAVYIGDWENGVKKGRGKVYNRNGKIIYEGLFADDAPTENYPNKPSNDSIYFSYLELEANDDRDEEFYIGEIENGKPNGFGFTLDNEGFIGIASYIDGEENGLGIMIMPPNMWFTFRVKDNRWYQIASYIEQNERKSNNRAIASERRMEILQALNTILDAGTQLSTTIAQRNMQPTEENSTKGNDTSNQGRNTSSNENKYSISEQNNYNTDKRTWGNYDSMLASHFAGNKPATKNEVVKWQQAMKKLRSKWTSKGKSFPQSANENRSTSGCANGSHSH